MYKSTSNNANFQRREGSHSTKPSARGVNLLGWACDEELSPEDKRSALAARVKQINVFLRDNRGKIPSEQRAEIVVELQSLEARIHAIRPKSRQPGAMSHFMDVARERLTNAEFNVWMAEAVKRLQRANGRPSSSPEPTAETKA